MTVLHTNKNRIYLFFFKHIIFLYIHTSLFTRITSLADAETPKTKSSRQGAHIFAKSWTKGTPDKKLHRGDTWQKVAHKGTLDKKLHKRDSWQKVAQKGHLTKSWTKGTLDKKLHKRDTWQKLHKRDTWQKVAQKGTLNKKLHKKDTWQKVAMIHIDGYTLIQSLNFKHTLKGIHWPGILLIQ